MNMTRRSQVLAAIIALVLLSAALAARAQAARFKVGDLVEYVSALGPMMGEVISGPDASNYYLLAIPGRDDFPIHADKLRVVQHAGSANAAINIGEAVSWTSANVAQNGSVVKVRGAWCQVKSVSATTIGWVECKALRTSKQNAKPPAPAGKEESTDGTPSTDGAAVANLSGDYENADGAMKLEFQPKGKCYISFGPMTGDCTYKQSGKKVAVHFEDEDMILTLDNDGSLRSAPDGGMTVRLKRKK
jgi:hypothetical protein